MAISFVVFGVIFYLTGVYASIDQDVCISLWDDLRLVSAMAPSLWLVIGDFNILVGTHKKTENPSSASSCQDFLLVLNDCVLHY